MYELGALVLAHIPALLMMIAGFVLLVVEMFIPGFGVAGISGLLMMVIGIFLMEGTAAQAFILALICIVLWAIAFALAMHSISKGKFSKSKMVLNAVLNQDQTEEEKDLSGYVGRLGQTRTALRPAGIAEFDGVKLNVVSDGSFVGADCCVCVERVEGNRIVVRECDHEGKPV